VTLQGLANLSRSLELQWIDIISSAIYKWLKQKTANQPGG